MAEAKCGCNFSPVRLLGQYGVLRLLLGALAIFIIIFAPAPATPPVYTGWPLLATVVIPAIAPIVFMVLMLDVLMSWVFTLEKPAGVRKRHRAIIVVNLLIVIGLSIRWVPYFMALGR